MVKGTAYSLDLDLASATEPPIECAYLVESL
jgi:hypothetical protein